MRLLKADFHTHTAEDPEDRVGHSAEMLIDAAAQESIDVLAISNHNSLLYNDYLAEYAKRRGLLLIPAVEKTIEGKHMLILNPAQGHLAASTFEDLRNAGKDGAAFIAPHPFFPMACALKGRLLENVDLFDAIESHSFYWYGLNFNGRARRFAKRHGLPIVGGSDTHLLPYCTSSHTLIDSEATVDAVVAAIRSGRVELRTRPRPFRLFLAMLMYILRPTRVPRPGPALGREAAR